MKTANRVAINTSVQYLRLILNVVIGLYSVRIILCALGADDYGIYDVVGGVIYLLGFISSSLAQTSIRFISVSLGKNNVEETKNTFNNCFWLHFLIAALLFTIMEIVGIFFLDGFLNIQPERMAAAEWVYHCMAFSVFVNVAITPFSALAVAHEKFIYTSFVSILDSLLKLAIAFALLYTLHDKLKVYALLMSGITIVNAVLYITYVRRIYREEVHISRPEKTGIRSVTGFAGWTMLDVLASTASRQGYAIMLNKFFGTTINAAFAIARQVEGHIYVISAAIIDTMKPQIMRSYGAGDIPRMFRLSMTAGKIGFSMMSIVSIPLIVLMPDILSLWLSNVPPLTVGFARLLLIACMVEQLTRALVYACQATGNIKWFTIIISACRIMALPVSIICFLLGLPVITAFYVYVTFEAAGALARIFVMKHLADFSISDFFGSVIVKIALPTASSLILCCVLTMFGNSLFALLSNIAMTSILFLMSMYLLGLDTNEKQIVKGLVARIKTKMK